MPMIAMTTSSSTSVKARGKSRRTVIWISAHLDIGIETSICVISENRGSAMSIVGKRYCKVDFQLLLPDLAQTANTSTGENLNWLPVRHFSVGEKIPACLANYRKS